MKIYQGPTKPKHTPPNLKNPNPHSFYLLEYINERPSANQATSHCYRRLQNADLREDPHREDHNPRGRGLGHDRQCQNEDPGQGGNSAGPAASDLRRKAARGRTYSRGLQYPEGVNPTRCPPSPWWILSPEVVVLFAVLTEALVLFNPLSKTFLLAYLCFFFLTVLFKWL